MTKYFAGTQTDEFVLSWPGAFKGQPMVTKKFYKMPRQSASVGTSTQTQRRWIKAQADIIEGRMVPYSKEHTIDILKCLGDRLGLVVLDPNEISLSIHDLIAIRDWVQTSNNGLYRMKQSIEALAPALAGKMFPAGILVKVSNEDKAGAIRVRVIELDCVITRTNNRRGMRNFYFSVNPMQLVMNMLRACILSGNFQNSIEFCKFADQIFVALGGDKSDNDYVFVMRICNRKKGNAGIHCQMASCLEGPVCEEYTNAMNTVGNSSYTTRGAFQNLLDDSYHALIFEGMDGEKRYVPRQHFSLFPHCYHLHLVLLVLSLTQQSLTR